MKNKRKQSGLTLTELVVTIAIAAILMAIAVPAAKRLAESLSHSAGAYGLISAALSNARAIATSQGKYAGLRFQQAADGRTYIIFIIHDERPVSDGGTGLANGFRPVEGRKAIAFPENSWVKSAAPEKDFSIVFSSAGKLVIHPVRYRGSLPFKPEELLDDGNDFTSQNQFEIYNEKNDSQPKTVMVSPYTGELIGGDQN